MKVVFFVWVSILLSINGFAQKNAARQKKEAPQRPVTRKPLDHSVYDSWKEITESELTRDGVFFAYGQNPQEGDGKVIFYNLQTGGTDSVSRGREVKFAYNSSYAALFIKPSLAQVKAAKREKKKKDEMPEDTLGVYRLQTRALEKIPGVVSFQLPEKSGEWLAYQVKNRKRKQNEESGYDLVIRRPDGKDEQTFGFVKEYTFSPDGKWLAFATSRKDSVRSAGVFALDLAGKKLHEAFTGKNGQRFTKLVFSEKGNRLAFIADLDTNSKTQVRKPALYVWENRGGPALRRADEGSIPGNKGWLVSAHRDLSFSKDGSRLFFGVNPLPVVPDTTLLPEEIVNVEVWHWRDTRLQTEQKVTLDKDRKRSYPAVCHLETGTLAVLGDEIVPEVEMADKGSGTWGLGVSKIAYSHEHWDWNPKQDVYLVNLVSGERRLVRKKLEGAARISPKGKYLYWFSNPDSAWFAYDIAAAKELRLTSNTPVRFTDEEDDHPDYPRPYGIAGWAEEDSALLVYDRFDLWKIVPRDSSRSRKLTSGRASKQVYRYIRTDPEETNLNFSRPLLLSCFNEENKRDAFCLLYPEGKTVPLIQGDYRLGRRVLKGKESTSLLFTRESFREFPDWHVLDPASGQTKQLTHANPQQQDYRWGTVALVDWLAGDGTPLRGLLYKPDDFDPSKKYPLMVYYYERNSDNLHAHFAPKPIRSYINFSYFVSNGYLVFVPDIVYQTGFPGKSAYNCLVPGVLRLIDKGFVDRDRIGISGHSWGGYQTAYLVSQTSMFRAAEAGAPVSNMTSAYGGIRWESGLTRQAQYERNQSRIGGTLWEKPMEFIENSPLFHAPKIETPLLILHNDDDGAVPWYQGIELYMGLKRLGKPVWMLNYNGEKHGLTKRQNMKDFAIRLYQFFDHYLKDAPAPQWLKEGLPMVEKGILQGLEPAGN